MLGRVSISEWWHVLRQQTILQGLQTSVQYSTGQACKDRLPWGGPHAELNLPCLPIMVGPISQARIHVTFVVPWSCPDPCARSDPQHTPNPVMRAHVVAHAGHGGSSASCQGQYSLASMGRDLHSFVLEQGVYASRFALVSPLSLYNGPLCVLQPGILLLTGSVLAVTCT